MHVAHRYLLMCPLTGPAHVAAATKGKRKALDQMNKVYFRL